MVDTKVKDETLKDPLVATDEFYVNDVAGGNLDKKGTISGIRIAGSQVSSGEIADARLSSNVPLLDATQTFTGINTFENALTPVDAIVSTSTTNAVNFAAKITHKTSATSIAGFGSGIRFFKDDGTPLSQGFIKFSEVSAISDKFEIGLGASGTIVFDIDESGVVDWRQGGNHDFQGGDLTNINDITSITSLNGVTILNYALATGDFYTGVHDFGSTTSLEIPNGAAPTVDAVGKIAVDTTITDHTGAIKYHDGVEEIQVIGVPLDKITTTDGHLISYNATNNEFEMTAAGAADNLGNHIATIRLQLDKGIDVASAGIMTLGTDGNTFDITGTTTINEILATGWQAGSVLYLQFDGILTVTHNSGGTNDILLGNQANMTTAAGDVLTLFFNGTDWVEISRSVVGGAGGSFTLPHYIPCHIVIPEGTVAFPDIHDMVTGSLHVSGGVFPDGAATSTFNIKPLLPLPEDLHSTPDLKLVVAMFPKDTEATNVNTRFTAKSLWHATGENLDQALTAETEVTIAMPTTIENMIVTTIALSTPTIAAGDLGLVQLTRDPTDAADVYAEGVQLVWAYLTCDRTVNS